MCFTHKDISEVTLRIIYVNSHTTSKLLTCEKNPFPVGYVVIVY